MLHAGPATTLDSRLVGEAGGPDVQVPVPAPYPSDHRGVVSTFRVDAVVPQPFAATQHRRIIQGDDVLVTWQLARDEAARDQRVGLVRRARRRTDVWVRSVNPTVGVRSGQPGEPGLAPGAYDLVLADRGGRRVLTGDRCYVYRASDHPTVTMTKAAFRR